MNFCKKKFYISSIFSFLCKKILYNLNLKKIKKLLFVLLFTLTSMVTFANTGEKKMTVPLKEKVETKATVENEELKVVTCYIQVDGEFEAYEYSCFFCWGRAMNGCYAAGCQFYATCGN